MGYSAEGAARIAQLLVRRSTVAAAREAVEFAIAKAAVKNPEKCDLWRAVLRALDGIDNRAPRRGSARRGPRPDISATEQD